MLWLNSAANDILDIRISLFISKAFADVIKLSEFVRSECQATERTIRTMKKMKNHEKDELSYIESNVISEILWQLNDSHGFCYRKLFGYRL